MLMRYMDILTARCNTLPVLCLKFFSRYIYVYLRSRVTDEGGTDSGRDIFHQLVHSLVATLTTAELG